VQATGKLYEEKRFPGEAFEFACTYQL